MLRKLDIFFGGGGGWRFFRLSHMYERSYAEEARCSRKWVWLKNIAVSSTETYQFLQKFNFDNGWAWEIN